MKKHIILSIAAFFAMTGSVMAADATSDTSPAAHSHPMIPATTTASASGNTSTDTQKDMTLDEAKKYYHERAEKAQKYSDKIDKMSEEDWAKEVKEHHAWKEKYAAMTPEARKQYWKEKNEKRKARENNEASAAKPTESSK